MSSILISVLGKGRPQSASGTRSGYETATYCFAGGERYTTSFFGLAAWQHLNRHPSPPERWLVLGTSGSIWAALSDMIEIPEQESAFNSLDAWSQRVRRASDSDEVVQADLDEFAHAHCGPTLAGRLRLALVPDAITRHDQAALITTLFEHLQPGDRVTLDITHGYRHLPVLLAFGSTSLRWLRDVRVQRVLYGKLEGTGRDQDKPVVDLSLCAEIAEQAAAYSTFHLTGQHEALAPMFPKATNDLRRLSYFEGLNHVARAKAPAMKVAAALRASDADEPTTPLLPLIAAELAGATEWAGRGTHAMRILERARFLRQHGQLLPAIMLYFEALRQHGCPPVRKPRREATARNHDSSGWFAPLLRRCDPQSMQRLKQLRMLRNLVAHVDRPKTKELARAMEQPDTMGKLLEGIDAAVERVISAKDADL